MRRRARRGAGIGAIRAKLERSTTTTLRFPERRLAQENATWRVETRETADAIASLLIREWPMYEHCFWLTWSFAATRVNMDVYVSRTGVIQFALKTTEIRVLRS
jgi:hypothetical protein